MKKITTLIIIVCLFLSFNSICQITKGNWMVGGNGSYSSTKYNSAQSIDGKTSTFQINPNVGYFIADKIACGVLANLTMIRRINSFNPTYYQIGPFARYYILPTEKKVNILTEVNYLYGNNNTPSRTTNTFSVFAGPVFYFNSSVGMEFTLGYYSTKYATYAGRDNTFQLALGFQIHLEKDK